jgi:hypothetical protein
MRTDHLMMETADLSETLIKLLPAAHMAAIFTTCTPLKPIWNLLHKKDICNHHYMSCSVNVTTFWQALSCSLYKLVSKINSPKNPVYSFLFTPLYHWKNAFSSVWAQHKLLANQHIHMHGSHTHEHDSPQLCYNICEKQKTTVCFKYQTYLKLTEICFVFTGSLNTRQTDFEKLCSSETWIMVTANNNFSRQRDPYLLLNVGKTGSHKTYAGTTGDQ